MAIIQGKNTRKTPASVRAQKKADSSALASMNAVRTRQNRTTQKSTGNTALYAPNSRPNVITVSGNTVFSNGRLISTRKDAEAAQAFAQRLTENGKAIIGDQGGETYRQLYKTDKGTQTGRANIDGITRSFASRGMAPVLDNGQVIGNRRIGSMTTKQFGDSGLELFVDGESVGVAQTGDELRAMQDKIIAEQEARDAEDASRRAGVGAARDRARSQVAGMGEQIPQNRYIPPKSTMFSRSAPVARDMAAEEAARKTVAEAEGVDPSTMSAAQLFHFNQKVNENVYGQANPTFATGALNTQQKAREQAIAANRNAVAAVAIEPEEVDTVVTSTAGEKFRDEELERLDQLTIGSAETVSESLNSLLETDADILAAQQSGEDMQTLLEQRQAFYEEQYNNLRSEIQRIYDEKADGYKEEAARAMGATMVQLARMGAVGVSTAAVQYVDDQQRADQAKLLSFAAEEAAALQSAYEAFVSADFNVAEEMINTAKATREEIRNIKTEALNRKAKIMELQKMERDSAAETIETMVASGMDVSSLPSGYLEYLDRKAGYPPGTSEGLWSVAQEERAEEKTKSEIEQATKLVSLLNELPVGESILINGVEYLSLNKGEVFHGSEDDGKGNTTIWTYNADTKEYSTKTLYGVSKQDGWEFQQNNGVGLWVNPSTRELQVAFDVNQPTANPSVLKSAFPDGYKPTNEDLAALGTYQLDPKTGGIQCGQFVRMLSSYEGPSLTDWSAKKALKDPTIGTDENPPQAGDVFLQAGGSRGHIGMVLGATKLEDGSYQLDIVDANAKGDGTIRYRQINSKNVYGFAREGWGLRPEFQFGTDSGDMQSSLQRFAQEESPEISVAQQASLRKEIAADKAITQYGDLKRTYTSMDAVLNSALAKPTDESRAQADQALITMFNKMLDPDSVVREGEYARTTQGQSLLAQAQSKYEQLVNGGAGITDQTRKDMVDIARTLFGEAEKQYQSSVDFYVPILEGYGLNPSRFIKGYGAEAEEVEVAQPGRVGADTISSLLVGQRLNNGTVITQAMADETAQEAMQLYEQGWTTQEIEDYLNEQLAD